MKTAGLVINRNKDEDLSISKKIAETFNKSGIILIVENKELKDILSPYAVYVSKNEFVKRAEAVFCVGGDGTLLNVAGRMGRHGLPLMGINIGRLGFLTELEYNELEDWICDIACDNYSIEERIMLEVSLHLGKRVIKDFCLNDFVVSRGGSPRLIDVKAYIDDDFVDSFTGDGVIVSTPTGSTAYSLSCGGPIAGPAMKVMLITPICPHNIYSRTFLADSSKTVRIESVEKNEYHGLVILDGQKSHLIESPLKAYIKTSDQPVKMIKINRKNFYDVIRKKLYNRGV